MERSAHLPDVHPIPKRYMYYKILEIVIEARSLLCIYTPGIFSDIKYLIEDKCAVQMDK